MSVGGNASPDTCGDTEASARSLQLYNNNNTYLPVKAGCQKSTSPTMLATLETNDNDYNNRKKTMQTTSAK